MQIESEHTVNVGQFFLTHGEALNFPLHLHRAFEYFGVRSGTANVIIDGETYTLDAGTAVLIFPYQLHSYQSAENCYEMAIFSPDMVESFAHRVNGLCPADNRFPLPPVYVPESSPNAFLKKSAAYALCGWFDAVAQYRPKTAPPPDDLLTNILLYVEAHRHSTCTLQDVAREVRYDYAYISKWGCSSMRTSIECGSRTPAGGSGAAGRVWNKLPNRADSHRCAVFTGRSMMWWVRHRRRIGTRRARL